MDPPSGFDWKGLSELARLESGHTPSRSIPEYWDGDIPWIGIRDATQNHGRIIGHTHQCVTELGIQNSSARVLPAHTVCLSRTASVGYVVMMDRPMSTSQDFLNWVCRPELIPRYLFYVLIAEQESVRRFAHGTTHQTLYYPEAKALHILVPSLSDQSAIVDVLGALDDKIEANRRTVSRSEALAQAIVGTLSPVGRLGELATVDRRMVSAASFASEEQVAHFSIPAFDAGRLPEIEPGSTIKSGKFLLDHPCVLVSRLNPHIPRAWMATPPADSLSLTSTEFVMLSPKAGQHVEVLWALCSAARFCSALNERVKGTTGSHQRVAPEDVLAIEVGDPSSLSDEEVDTVRSSVQLAASLRQESSSLARLRDTLLPKLVSGELRVRNAESLVGEAV